MAKSLICVFVLALLLGALGQPTQSVTGQVCQVGESWTDGEGVTFVCDPKSPSGWSPKGSQSAPSPTPTPTTTQSQDCGWFLKLLGFCGDPTAADYQKNQQQTMIAPLYFSETFGQVFIQWLQTPPDEADVGTVLILVAADGPLPFGDALGVVYVGSRTAAYVYKLARVAGVTVLAQATIAGFREMARNGTLEAIFASSATASVAGFPVAQKSPPVSGAHNPSHTPATDTEAQARAQSVIDAWVVISAQTAFSTPPDPNGDRFRCAVIVLGKEVVRFIVFEATKNTGFNIKGSMNVWQADGSGWVTSFGDSRYKDLSKAPTDLKGATSQEVKCSDIGGWGPPPTSLTAAMQ